MHSERLFFKNKNSILYAIHILSFYRFQCFFLYCTKISSFTIYTSRVWRLKYKKKKSPCLCSDMSDQIYGSDKSDQSQEFRLVTQSSSRNLSFATNDDQIRCSHRSIASYANSFWLFTQSFVTNEREEKLRDEPKEHLRRNNSVFLYLYHSKK